MTYLGTGDILEGTPRDRGVETLLPSGGRRIELSPLQREILRTLLYFDIFGHPLTAREIRSFLSIREEDDRAIDRACAAPQLKEIVTRQGPYYSLARSGPALPEKRLRKEERARRLWRIAPLVGSFISCFPWVRSVCVSGELSKGVASEGADIDFFIVAAEHRVWISRTLLVLFKKVFLLNSKTFFCINHLLCDGHMGIREKTYYSAVEAVTLRPIFNPTLRDSYLRANPWIRSMLPNHPALREDTAVPARRRPVQAVVESLLPARWLDRIDQALQRRWQAAWRARYPHLPEEQRSRLYKCSAHLSTAYGNDYERSIASRWGERLMAHGFEPAA